MKIVFLSNFFNHHQKPFSDELYRLNSDYFFIETSPIPIEQKAMGYEIGDIPTYVLNFSNDKDLCIKLINNADVLIIGSAPEKLISGAKKKNKVIIRYCERPLKKGFEILKYLPRFIKWHYRNPAKRPIYMLCASAYTAGDYRKFALFKNKTYKWAYFTEVKSFDNINVLLEAKCKKSILWASRLISWKHPELAVYLAEYLVHKGIDFNMNIIGSGSQEKKLNELICSKRLENKVHMLGLRTHEQVRSIMENTEIFISTSDRQEGWGATVNEAMSSVCAVVADRRIGSVPFLIKDGVNGFAYNSKLEFFEKVEQLLTNDELRIRMSKKAYETMLGVWNPQVAASRFLKLSECLIKSGRCDCFENGPCSKSI